MRNTPSSLHPSACPASGFGLIPISEYRDCRGTLGVVEGESDVLPFALKRVFWIYGVPAGEERGHHAHHTCAEVLVPLSGAFTATVHDGEREATYRVDSPASGLYIPAMTWCAFSDFTPDCVCLCLASEDYRPEGYLNTFEDFLRAVRASR